MDLVTGGNGFIGINIVRALLKKGERVRVLDVARPEAGVINDNFEYFYGDITKKGDVANICKGVRHIYHTAALVPVSRAGKRFWEVNVEGTRNILEEALKEGIKKVIHLSSTAIYDINQPLPFREESRIKPIGDYGRSKYEAEKVCHEYRKKGLDITIVRPRTVVGQERLGIFQILYDWLRRGKKIFIIGSGKNKIQFIYIKDLVNAVVLMAEKASNEAFNIGTDRFNTLSEDLGALIHYAGTKSKLFSINPFLAVSILKVLDRLNLSPLSEWHYLTYFKDFYCDIEKAKRLLGWQPHYSNAEMLIESYQWYIDHLNEVEKNIGTTHRKGAQQKLLKILRDIS